MVCLKPGRGSSKTPMRSPRIKIFALFLWGCLILAALYHGYSQNIALDDIPLKLQEGVDRLGNWGPLYFILVYILRPFLFFPPSILCATAGLVFGPWMGIFLTILGENLSAQITYQMGKIFAAQVVIRFTQKQGVSAQIFATLRDHNFLSVLILRLTYLPFDLVGAVCGAYKIRQRDFVLGTFLGTLPGIMGFVFLGGSISDSKNLAIVGLSVLIGTVLFRLSQKSGNPKRSCV
jgi:uncharacterized membrane protein YdjX (TVP38/TMEM64 family)